MSIELAQKIKEKAAELGIPQRSLSDEEILRRLLFASVNEACKVLEEGKVYRASDIDVMWLGCATRLFDGRHKERSVRQGHPRDPILDFEHEARRTANRRARMIAIRVFDKSSPSRSVHNRQIISTVFRVNMLARLASEGRKLIADRPVSMALPHVYMGSILRAYVGDVIHVSSGLVG